MAPILGKRCACQLCGCGHERGHLVALYPLPDWHVAFDGRHLVCGPGRLSVAAVAQLPRAIERPLAVNWEDGRGRGFLDSIFAFGRIAPRELGR